jgi:class 3 adenylate cyclase
VNSPALPSEHPDRPVALLLTDLVDSAALAQRLGDEAMARVWTGHDRVARDLLRIWRGREIDKTDGFLLVFAEAADALGCVLAYQRALHALETAIQAALPPGDGAPPRLQARAGLHVGEVTVRENPAADVALGAKPLEVDGVTKPLTARVMSTALGGQTLITAAARDALGVMAHRAVRQGDLWLPARGTRHTLPAERDAFVDRRSTLQELARRFDGGARLVSLLGIGGCGKSRVATRFGWQWLGGLSWRRVVLRPGCGTHAPRPVRRRGPGPGRAVGPRRPGAAAAPRHRRPRALQVVLDNIEQLARHAQATVGQRLERAGAGHFLMTTREALAAAREPGHARLERTVLANLAWCRRLPAAPPKPWPATSLPWRWRGRWATGAPKRRSWATWSWRWHAWASTGPRASSCSKGWPSCAPAATCSAWA